MAAGGSVIGALRVVLGVDSAALETGLKKASSSLGSFSNSVTKAGLAITAGLVTAFGALGMSIKGAINEADKLGKLAQSIGIPVEELSRLKHAADLSDVSLEALGKSVGLLSKNMASAATDIQGKAAIAFRQLGIEVKNSDGTLKSSTQIITGVSEKFSTMKDGAAKTAMALALFGRAGAAMIPMLNQGAAGLKAMMAEADALGIVITEKTGAAAEEFNDNLKRLSKVKDGIIIQLTAELLPALLRFSQFMIEGAKNSELLKSVASGLSSALEGVMRATVFVYDNLKVLYDLFLILIAAKVATIVFGIGVAFVQLAFAIRAAGIATVLFNAAKMITIGRLVVFGGLIAWATGNLELMKEKLGGLADVVKNLLPEDIGKKLMGLLGGGLDFSALTKDLALFGAELPKVKKGTDDLALANVKGAQAVDAFLKSQEKQLAGLKAEVETFGMSAGAKEKAKLQLEALAVATANHTKLTTLQQAEVNRLAGAFEQLKLKLAGLKLIEEVQPAWVKQNIELQKAAAALATLNPTAEQTAAVFLKIKFPSLAGAIDQALDLRGRLDELATSIARNMSGALVDFAMGTKTAEEAFKAFATSVIKMLLEMIIQALIFKAIKLALGFPFADGGLVKFKDGGLAGYPMGGRVTGPGTGTSDSIFARLSNGEFVVNAAATKQNLPLLQAINSGDEPAAGVSESSAQRIGASKVLIVKGFSTREFFRGDQVRDLCENISQHVRDGGRLEVSPA